MWVIDTTSAAGKMVFQMLAVLAEFERNQISERTKAAMSHMREQGSFLGEVPFGYDLRADGETLIENPGELETIALIKSLREKGYSLQGIAKELHALNISTKRGKLWAPQTVSNVLNRSA
jgi:site-specific DNA recombinase